MVSYSLSSLHYSVSTKVGLVNLGKISTTYPFHTSGHYCFSGEPPDIVFSNFQMDLSRETVVTMWTTQSSGALKEGICLLFIHCHPETICLSSDCVGYVCSYQPHPLLWCQVRCEARS